MYNSARWAADERGQTTLALVGVIAVAALMIVALATVGQAMVHRARARNAADAVSLATVADTESAHALSQWYRGQGVDVTVEENRAYARSGPSQAAAWADLGQTVDRAPVLVAVVARAEQLVGAPIIVQRWNPTSIDLNTDQAGMLRSVASDLGLCERTRAAPSTAVVRFELC